MWLMTSSIKTQVFILVARSLYWAIMQEIYILVMKVKVLIDGNCIIQKPPLSVIYFEMSIL